jgi:hypothetical protein
MHANERLRSMRDDELTLFRVSLLRIAFFLNLVFLGMNFVTGYRNHSGPWESGTTVAYSLWGTLAVLSAFGLRQPTRMVPVLLVQFTYKLIWVALFYLPGNAPAASGLAPVMFAGLVGDLVIIPWPHVLRTVILAPSERWTRRELKPAPLTAI